MHCCIECDLRSRTDCRLRRLPHRSDGLRSKALRAAGSRSQRGPAAPLLPAGDRPRWIPAEHQAGNRTCGHLFCGMGPNIHCDVVGGLEVQPIAEERGQNRHDVVYTV